MKYKNSMIVNNLNILGAFAEKRLQQRISYAITRNLMLLQKEYQCYETEMKKLQEKYADSIMYTDNKEITRDNYGVPVLKNAEEQKNYNKDLFELLNIEVEIPLFFISNEEFNYNDDTGRYDPMSASDIMALQSVLCNENAN